MAKKKVTKKKATKKASKKVCVNCGNNKCDTFIVYKSKLFCCDDCKKKYVGKGKKPEICEFC